MGGNFGFESKTNKLTKEVYLSEKTKNKTFIANSLILPNIRQWKTDPHNNINSRRYNNADYASFRRWNYMDES